MAGTIVADTLQDGAGNSTAMDNAIYGSAKAWVNFNGSTGTRNSYYNVSSITRNGTGDYTVNFTNPFPNIYYVWQIRAANSTNGAWGIGLLADPTTTTLRFYTQAYNTNNTDYAYTCVSVHSN